MDDLLLSADGDISLYHVKKEIIDKFDVILDDFYKWKKTNCYDETLFVKYVKNKYGEESIKFVKIVGCYGGKLVNNVVVNPNEHDIEEKYKNTKHYNF